MKRLIATALILCLASAASAGVSGITENGSSASGKTAYKITCSNGREWRIWNADGQWWDGSGAQGGNSRNLNEQAAFLCR